MSEAEKRSGQSQLAAKKNAQFFLEEHSTYKEKIASIDTYSTISSALNKELAGVESLLDIGNGGVFDYDTSLVEKITGLDLFLSSLPPTVEIPKNVTMVQGSALSIPSDLHGFDAVVMVMLIHHLVGDTTSACRANVTQAFTEASRVLRKGGKLVVMDSCVPSWFYAFEHLAFRSASWVIERTMKHPPVLQYTQRQVVNMMTVAGFGDISVAAIPKGRFILQFGAKVPSFLTPTQPILFVARR
jgi:ubiquinone/menaquinone biosynthesis C-methylase UbiE